MIDPNAVYTAIKFWLPLISGFLLVVKAYVTAKRNIGTYMNTLMHNHLAHIQEATIATVDETKKTNDILIESMRKTNYIAERVDDHTEKETQIWQGVVNTLAVIEDRTRRKTSTRRAKR